MVLAKVGKEIARLQRRQLTLRQWLQALKGDLELVLVNQAGRIVDDRDAEQRNDRHLE